jgi:hypothetical protein
MSQFDRYWSVDLSIDRESFRKAFHAVVQDARAALVIQNTGLHAHTRKDFFGEITENSFLIWKRKGWLDLASTGLLLEGNIAAAAGGINLQLRILNNFTFTHFKMLLTDVIVTALLSVILFGLFDRLFHLEKYFWTGFAAIAIVTTYFVNRLHLRMIQKYLDRLQAYYTQVLFQIQDAAKEVAE